MPSVPPEPALAPAEQIACHSPWLKMRLLIRAVLTQRWVVDTWTEVKERLPGLMAEERRLWRGGCTEEQVMDRGTFVGGGPTR
jgi:hypothetical protein